jgi:hypothetical protein
MSKQLYLIGAASLVSYVLYITCMWSDRYYYLNIFHDKELSLFCSTQTLKNHLSSFPELMKDGDFHFKESTLFPFASINLLYAKSYDSWSGDDTNDDYTNLIAIVCAKKNEEIFQTQLPVFIRIASFLGWTLVDERTDDEVEDYILWAPARTY